MRIIGGTASGRLLKAPTGLNIRPTPDKVRQAIFNSLGDRIINAEVLELFAGTGALSLECLSRGAKLAVCIEKAPRHAQCLRANRDTLNFTGDLEILTQDVFKAIRQLKVKGAQYDLILTDPPFGPKCQNGRSQSDSQLLLQEADLPRLLKPEGKMILGHAHRDHLSVTPPWSLVKTMRHGDSSFLFLQLE